MIYPIHVISLVVQTLIFTAFFCFTLSPRYKKHWLFVLMMAVAIGSVSVMFDMADETIIPFLPVVLRYRTIILLTLQFIFVCWIYKDKFSKKLIAFALFTINLFLCDMLSGVIFIMITGKDITAAGKTITPEKVLAEMMFILFFSAASYVAAYALKNNKIHMTRQSFLITLLFPITQIILIYNSFYTHNNEITTAFVISVAIEVICCIAVDMIVINMLNAITKAAALQEKLKWSEGLKIAEENYYDTLQEKTREVMKIRHEINDRIQTALLLMKEEKDESRLKAEEILKNTYSVLLDTRMPVFCENAVCNMIFNAKMSKIEENSIKCNFSFMLPDKLPIDDSDLCSVVSNLMNNAIEGCIKFPECNRKIDVIAEINAGYVIFKVANPTSETPLFKNGKPVTSKKDKNSHGFGFEYLKEIAEKYDGRVKAEVENGMFITEVILKA